MSDPLLRPHLLARCPYHLSPEQEQAERVRLAAIAQAKRTEAATKRAVSGQLTVDEIAAQDVAARRAQEAADREELAAYRAGTHPSQRKEVSE